MRAALGTAFSLLMSAFAAGQPPGGTPQQPPVFRGEAVLVAVPVFVTDGSGKAVPGLTAEDFEVQDCVVVYPEDFFTGDDFDENGSFVGDLSKHDLTKGGEVVDQATLEGSDESTAPIHFTWQAPDDLVGGDNCCRSH